jgi:hypothetical protein
LLGLRGRIPPEVVKSIVRVVYCQVEVSVTGRPFARRSPTEDGVVCLRDCDNANSITRRPKPTRAVEPRNIRTGNVRVT